ncbi:MAG: preprotein translocase subunit SecA, partial [Planctomycetota bacterium]|nr:preprotein translocase subunit SecA [Planctomycetota bacterium]
MADIPILGPIINRIVGTRNERFVKKYTQRVNAINSIEDKTRALTDEQIRGKIHEFRARLDKGEKADDLMVEAFAVAREAMDRAVGIRQIFNPKRNFDPALLPERLRETYARLRAEADAKAPAEPIGPFQGCSDAVPGYMQIEIPNEIYEAVRELYPESRPPFRARPFDVQLIGGMVLTQGKIAEMKTGEGKTIVAPLATYLAVIQRMKVHVVTVNDYLVQRDRDWTFPYFWALGLTVGAIHPIHMQPEDVKRIMYRCDVVYGTTAEFGFDYLRDNMKRRAEEQVQRRRNFAIVDEVDSILIDEARTPLIISGSAHDDQPRYELADRIARHLVEKQRPWQTADDRVSDCKKKIKGYEGEIRQTRDRGRIPEFERLIKELKADLPRLEAERTKHVQYYEVAMERKQSHLTHDGIAEAQRVAGLGSFYVEQNMDLPHLVEQALRAHVVYTRDKDYVVMQVPDQATGRVQPGVVIVDVNTGRPMVGRQWSDGLHQAVECKEKVPIKQETQTVATITIQNFFKMYKRLAGMTGTADTEAQEFNDIYKLDVVAIPTNRAVTRRDFQDMVFLGERDKWNWIVDEIKAFHDVGRPILVGTTSVEKSEMLSKMLTQKYGVQHEVLNAKQHEREANIVEDAGQLGAVMIATNMAGRGTDIKLGAITRETLLDHWLRRGIAPRTVTVESTVEQLREGVYRKVAPAELGIPKREAGEMPFADLELKLLRHWAGKSTWLDDKAIDRMKADELRAELDKSGRFLLHNLRWYESIEDLGGLHVIGTERHEARRIDNQLRGRSGRQGDKGSTRFFVSFEDDLMKLFGGESQMRLMSRFGMKEGDAIEHPWVSSAIERAQRKVEERNFQIRKTVLEYDEVMEYQRQTFYGLRQRVLEGRDVKGLLLDWIGRAVRDAIEEYTDPDYAAICAAEFAKARLDTSVPHERLKGRDRVEMEMAIRTEAKADARTNIDVTLGEYIPLEGSEIAVDFDSAGLISWARSKFGVELNPQEIREGGAEERAHVKRMLIQAAEDKIDSTDLDGLDEFVDGEYGLKRLSAWAKDKLTIAVSLDELKRARKNAELPEDDEDTTPLEQRDDAKLNLQQLIMKRARQLYRLREIEYPV